MRKILNIIYTITLIMTLAGTGGCIDDDFSTSPSHVLSFSTDTLAFDTIFTDLRTPTASFTVYNRGSKMLNISEIRVANLNPQATFRINVDGINATEFSNIEIRGGDSIFVFVQAFLEPNGTNIPLEITDRIDFVTNGVTQQVTLTAWGQDVERLRKITFTESATLSAEKPYVIFDTLTVNEGVTLNIDPGATLYFHDKAAMVVHGTLLALGEQGKEITLRGDRTDKVVGGIDFDIMSGQWGGIHFTGKSIGNRMEYVNMRSSSHGIEVDSCTAGDGIKLHVVNSALQNSATSILSARHSSIVLEGTQLSEAAENIVSITGGKLRASNCTFANQYLFAIIRSAILNIEYALPNDINGDAQPTEAVIENCILHGNCPELNIDDFTGSKVYFYNTLFKSGGTDDDNFINCVWEGNPNFYTVRNEYIFDYRLKDESDALGIGDNARVPQSSLYDRFGNYRFRKLPDGTLCCDAGAYVWTAAEEKEQ